MRGRRSSVTAAGWVAVVATVGTVCGLRALPVWAANAAVLWAAWLGLLAVVILLPALTVSVIRRLRRPRRPADVWVDIEETLAREAPSAVPRLPQAGRACAGMPIPARSRIRSTRLTKAS